MNAHAACPPDLNFKAGLLWALSAILSFHLACGFVAGAFLVGVHLFSLLQLSRVGGRWPAIALEWGTGLLIYGPQLGFFWAVFGPGAIALWLVLAFWLRLFVLLLRATRQRLGPGWAALAAPVLWTGLEYFRSELYYLRFSWIIPGYTFAWSPVLPVLKWIGMYGVGFVLMALAAGVWILPRRHAVLTGGILLAALAALTHMPLTAPARPDDTTKPLRVAGVQLEFPGEIEVLHALARVRRDQPDAALFVLSEYTFDGPVPDRVKNWCRTNQVHLVAGGKDFFAEDEFRNTVFVVAPSGEIVFKQAKAVPIQFFKDGARATEQRVWESPWGRIGICICYDLSYTRVVDELVRRGAQLLLVPTMDMAEWGGPQHRLHARVAPVRAAEHALPVFRLASSGISQWVDARGRVRASAPFPGDGAILTAELDLPAGGSRPLDRVLAPAASGLTALLALGLTIQELLAFRARRRLASGQA